MLGGKSPFGEKKSQKSRLRSSASAINTPPAAIRKAAMLFLSSCAADRTFANKRAIPRVRQEEAITSVVSGGFLYELDIETTTS